MKRKLKWILPAILILVLLALGGGLWDASNQLLFPVWRGITKDLSVCNPETEKYWGAGCGNLRSTHEFKFSEVKIPSTNGYELPSWRIGTSENGKGPAQGAIFLIHGGGSDRREVTRYIRFFLNQKLDVFTLDLGCHGEAPCPAPGLTYGNRESRDVFSAYLYLAGKYQKLYTFGSSVGAASILIALPEMPKLSAAIAENPMLSFQKLIAEFPGAQSIPSWFVQLLIKLTMLRGGFDGLLSSENSLRLIKTTPIFFIHSKADNVVSYLHTQALADLYAGPKSVWFPEEGSHGAIRDVNPATYEKRIADFLGSLR